MNCQTEGVVYKLSCKHCPEWVYIGETGRRVCDRVADHRSAIYQKKLDHPVGAHFCQPGHSVTDLVALPIEKVLPTGNVLLRRRREKLWINNYNSVDNGANRRE